MKPGRLRSIDASEGFRPEAVEILSYLQGQVEPIDSPTSRDFLERELGEE
jgi:hypothetical protein